jgi:hypothetical protein
MAKGRSLHIGLNSVSGPAYGGWTGPLVACEADANDMEQLAKRQGFATTKLLTRSGTRAKVLAAINAAAKALVAGDMFFLTYSGHGGQLPDLNGDETDDHADETWCLYDGELVDDQVNAALAAFAAGVRVLVLSDSCHSGTATRVMNASGEPVRYDAKGQVMVNPAGFAIRMMPPQFSLSAYTAQKAAYDRALTRPAPPAPKASVVLISGCQDVQTSLDGAFNGLFTGTLKVVWANGAFAGNYKAFHKAIVGKMPATQRPNLFTTGASSTAFLAQKPFKI